MYALDMQMYLSHSECWPVVTGEYPETIIGEQGADEEDVIKWQEAYDRAYTIIFTSLDKEMKKTGASILRCGAS